MAYTKRDIVVQAFEEIGLAAYVFDLQPQQLDGALRRLDNMMATWNGKGIRLGYPLPSSPSESDLSQDINVPDTAYEAMSLNLAIRIAPGYGKAVSPDTKAAAKSAYNQIIAQSAKPIEMQLNADSIPAGAGNKRNRNDNSPFLARPSNPLLAGPDSLLDLDY
tara:strand:+ start:4502 stop:4990 length:489 start_codon:yes stop_codon:yes gene_type:complete